MQKLLIVVDMQNDFIDGALGTKEAVAIVPNVLKKLEEFDGTVLFNISAGFNAYDESRMNERYGEQLGHRGMGDTQQ